LVQGLGAHRGTHQAVPRHTSSITSIMPALLMTSVLGHSKRILQDCRNVQQAASQGSGRIPASPATVCDSEAPPRPAPVAALSLATAQGCSTKAVASAGWPRLANPGGGLYFSLLGGVPVNSPEAPPLPKNPLLTGTPASWPHAPLTHSAPRGPYTLTALT
jgi:hypothetical protein